jgi:AcrR family transcriptional regulator
VDNEQLILAAAEELFYERSFDGVGVAAIGARAGVNPSSIYRYFESKDEILSVIFDRAIDALQRHTADRCDSPGDELEYLITGHAEFALENRRLASIWAREGQTLVDPYLRRIQRRQKQYIDRWVECLSALYPGRRRADLLVVVRAVHAVLTSDATRPPQAPGSKLVKVLLVASALRAVEALDLVPAGQ